jgi:hypothetical protein
MLASNGASHSRGRADSRKSRLVIRPGTRCGNRDTRPCGHQHESAPASALARASRLRRQRAEMTRFTDLLRRAVGADQPATLSAHSETFGSSSRMPVGPRMQGRARSASPFIVALARVTNAVVSRDRLSLTAAADVTRFSSHTAGARWAGRPGSLRPSSRLASRPGQARCPGRCRRIAVCPGRRLRGR